MKVISIIGGGLSGTLTAINLLENAAEEIKVYVFEKNEKLKNRGIAYQQQFTVQPLNVVASKMSLYSNNPRHFVEWLEQNRHKYTNILPEFDENTFVPRSIYGDYIEATADVYKSKIQYVYAEVTDIRKAVNGDITIATSKGEHIHTNFLILALGNYPPSDHSVFQQKDITESGLYKPYPWQEGLFDSVKKTDTILIIGSGLTMLDMLLKLNKEKHKGHIWVLSRNGFLPQKHLHTVPFKVQLPLNLDYSAHGIMTWIRGLVKSSEMAGTDWRAIIDGLREHTTLIWKQLPLAEKQKFLKRLRPFWETHRHRMPHSTYTLVQKLLKEERLHVLAATLKSVKYTSGVLTVTYSDKLKRTEAEIKASCVINCTGPESDYRKLNSPIINNLKLHGLLSTDELNIGIKTNDDGNLINKSGAAETEIYAIGSLRKGTLWESTALKEIREQSELIVKKILSA